MLHTCPKLDVCTYRSNNMKAVKVIYAWLEDAHGEV